MLPSLWKAVGGGGIYWSVTEYVCENTENYAHINKLQNTKSTCPASVFPPLILLSGEQHTIINRKTKHGGALVSCDMCEYQAGQNADVLRHKVHFFKTKVDLRNGLFLKGRVLFIKLFFLLYFCLKLRIKRVGTNKNLTDFYNYQIVRNSLIPYTVSRRRKRHFLLIRKGLLFQALSLCHRICFVLY